MQFNHELYPLTDTKKASEYLRGSNQKGILFVFNKGENAHIAFLKKIIAAAKLDADKDIALLPLPDLETINIMGVAEQHGVSSLITFGIDAKMLCLNLTLPPYQCREFSGVTILLAENLAKVQDDKQSKRNLWLALKEMFDV